MKSEEFDPALKMIFLFDIFDVEVDKVDAEVVNFLAAETAFVAAQLKTSVRRR
jgi:hypothetical protein